MKVKVKICGIKTVEAAQAASDAGADFLGFNFVPTSKRYIKPKEAKNIIDKLKRPINKVGVFMDADFAEVNKLINDLKLDYVQLHGNESPKYASLVIGARMMKTFSLPFDFDVEETIRKMKSYKADYFLLDRAIQGKGELLNSAKVRDLASIFPVILAGGLNPENVARIIHLTKPQVVDVAGGVETDETKDTNKIVEFIQAVEQIT